MSERVVVDNSILTSVAACQMQAVMQYVWHLRSVETAVAAKCGKAVHLALARHFASGGEGDVEGALGVFDEGYKEFAEENVLPGDRLEWWNVRAILESWLARHKPKGFGFEVLEEWIEKGYMVELDREEGIWFFSLTDMVVRERNTGGLYPLDHKTTGRISTWWKKKFYLSSQQTGQIWCTQRKFGETVAGAFLNVIELPKLPDSNYRCKKHKMKYSECVRNVELRYEHFGKELLLAGRNEQVLRQWEVDARLLARKFKNYVRLFPSVDYLPALQMEGVFNGSCTFCEYAKFCAGGRQEFALEGMFVREKWAPWEEEGVKVEVLD